VAAGLLIIALPLETPKGCANQEKGPGEVHDVKPLNDSSGYPGKSGGAGDRNDQKKITLRAIWKPDREVTITWQVDNRRNQFSWYSAPWERVEYGTRGSTASLLVENHGEGGYTQCLIYVDGQLLKPQPGDAHFDPFMQRNDAGDCRVSVIIP
jgi:hypothetical protein